jgi:L-fucose isomerase-like protein
MKVENMVQSPKDPDIRWEALRVSWAAHSGAGPDTHEKAEEYIRRLLPENSYVMTDEQPDIILFMSGGSERKAVSLAAAGQPVLLLSIRGNNAFAAATEVMAWMVNNNRFAVLSDALDASETGLLERWRKTVSAWKRLQGMRAGLIGSVSEWLVASGVPAERLNSVFGVSLEVIPWNTLPDYSGMTPDAALHERFKDRSAAGLEDAAKVLALLRRVVSEHDLNAIAVECFSLVQQRGVTACLALAQLNSEGLVSACEGDLASMAGMMLIKAATGSVPWMANTTRVTQRTLILSHCTIAFDMVSDVKLPTHYETDCSLAVDGNIPAGRVTFFRLSESLDRAFVAEGEVVSRPHLADACRTQVEIELSEEHLRLLREKPLGNHLLMLPGIYGDLLRLVCSWKGIIVQTSPFL